MKTLAQWFEEYGASHRHPLNKRLHWICVPLIVFAVVCALVCVPLGGAVFNAATLIGSAALLYYFVLSWRLAVGMLLVFAAMYGGALALRATLGGGLLGLAATIFVLAWIGQFIGHRFERQQPSFFRDLQFLLIGPLWLLDDLYRRLRLPTR